jgi:hypothetical protein
MYDSDPLLVKVLLDPHGPPLAERAGQPRPTPGRGQQASAWPSGRLARSSRRMAAGIGVRLVRLGERLEQYGRPQQKPDSPDGWHSGSQRRTLHQEA